MATTQNGIYYQDDYTKNADILTDMKQMAESIDGIIEEEKETTEQTIQQIQETQTAQNQKIQELDDNQIHVTTEKSSNINVQDASEQNAKINVFGISKQETSVQGNNYFDINRANFQKGSIGEDGVTINPNSDNYYTENYIELDKAKYFLYEVEVNDYNRVFIYDNSKNFVRSVNTRGTFLQTPLEFELVDNEKYIRMHYYTTETTNRKIMLSKDSAKDYEEFVPDSPSPEYPSEIENVTGDIDITVCNKNLFDFNNLENTNIITVNENGSITLANNTNSAGYTNTGKKLKELCRGLKVGDVAYLKLITTFSNEGIYLQGSNSYSWTNGYSKTITEDMLEDIVVFYGGYQKADTVQIQITRNSLEDYEIHEQQLTTFPLQEGQKMYEDSYLADDGIHHKRKQIELDGTENWNTLEEQNTENTIYITTANFDNEMSKTESSILCNIAKQGTVWDTDEGDKVINQKVYSALRFRMWKKDFADINSWKTYLAQQKQAGTPVIIEYETEEETIEAYTEEQQEAQLQNAKTYKTVTNVFTENAELEMEYIVDTKTYVDNEINSIKEQINTINELLSTTNTSALLLDNLQTDLESEVL